MAKAKAADRQSKSDLEAIMVYAPGKQGRPYAQNMA